MKKTDFVIKIEDVESGEDLLTMQISAWKGKYMVDEHLCEKYPKLEELDLADLGEGTLEYCGEMSKQEMSDALIKQGFKTQVI